MSIHEVKLQGHVAVAEGTLAFRFSKPDGFVFKAGQAIRLELIDPPADAGQGSRTLSLVSAPFEQELMVATRMRDSAFKRALKALPEGAGIRLDGPFGDLTLGDAGRPAVFIAGGIGITPFRSMLQYLLDRQEARPIVVLYGTERQEDIAYRDLLDAAWRELGIPTVHAVADGAMRGQYPGHIDAQFMRHAVPDYRERIFYISGPQAMVKAVRRKLQRMGVRRSRIRVDFFPGFA